VSAEGRYAELVAKLSRRRGVSRVTEGKGFGSSGQLKVDGRIFAMLVRGALVLKLPVWRVDELLVAGDGERFDAGKGKPMREWFVLSPTSIQAWLPLAEESMRFVGRKRNASRRAEMARRLSELL
jgi:hypothetical protein